MSAASAEARSGTLDCIRGLSALAVVLFHLNEPYPMPGDWYHRAAKLGWLGVTSFFVISGFCIAHARQRDAMTTYWGRRLLRIYPPYWASLAVVLVVILIRKGWVHVNDVAVLPHDPAALLCTLAALTTPATSTPAINWVYWSLGYEIAFYVVMGLAFGRSSFPGVLAFSLGALAFGGSGFPFDQWGFFGLGVSAYYLVQGSRFRGLLLLVVCAAAAGIGHSAAELAVALGTLLLVVFPREICARPGAAAFRVLGRWSYSLYLIHVPVGCYLGTALLDVYFPRTPGSLLMRDFCLVALCLAVTGVFHALIEKPSHCLARRWPGARNRTSASDDSRDRG